MYNRTEQRCSFCRRPETQPFWFSSKSVTFSRQRCFCLLICGLHALMESVMRRGVPKHFLPRNGHRDVPHPVYVCRYQTAISKHLLILYDAVRTYLHTYIQDGVSNSGK